MNFDLKDIFKFKNFSMIKKKNKYSYTAIKTQSNLPKYRKT